MSGASNIEWCDVTWNPIRGCSRVSAGCMNCYAERQAIRQINTGYAGLIQRTSHGPAWTGEVRLVGSLLDPLHWRKPRRVFVNSMSDLFHENVPPHWLHQIFVVMAMCPQHTFIVLTKRPKEMHDYVAGVAADRWLQCRLVDHADLLVNYDDESAGAVIVARNVLRARQARGEFQWPLPNVWLGVSVEDQATADERIPLLLQTPAAVRFVSYEPALGLVDFTSIAWPDKFGHRVDALRAGYWNKAGILACGPSAELGAERGGFTNHSDMNRLSWLIVGGESGPKARDCSIDWIRSTVQQCAAAGVPCFVKQLGAMPLLQHAEFDPPKINRDGKSYTGEWLYAKFNDRKGGDITEWPEDLRVREFPR